MSPSLWNKALVAIALTLALLWTLVLGLAYALLGLSDEASLWVQSLLDVPPLLSECLAGTGAWLLQWSGWLIALVWVLGLVGLTLLAWFARRLVGWFLAVRQEGYLP